MPRYTIFYEKRREACFVPHVALSSVFSRSAARVITPSGRIKFQFTEGFSPRVKISFGPELPVGVVALEEPVDVWIEELDDARFTAWQQNLPAGFRFLRFEKVDDGTPVLSKRYCGSTYLFGTDVNDNLTRVEDFLFKYNERENCGFEIAETYETDLDPEEHRDFIRVFFSNKISISSIVRAMIAENVVLGWNELCIVRLCMRRT